MADRAEFWRRMVAAWESSGLTQVEFCRRRGLKAVTFGWWKRRLVGASGRSARNDRNRPGGRGSRRGCGCRGPRRRRRASVKQDHRRRPNASPSKPSFVEVAMASGLDRSAQASGWDSTPGPTYEVVLHPYEVALPCGASIRLPRDFDPEKATELIQAARSC